MGTINTHIEEGDGFKVLRYGLGSIVLIIGYDGLLVAVNQRDVDVFRPLNKRGEPGRRHVRKEEMRRYIKTLEE